MTLPNESSIKLPLLLELERAGGSVRTGPEFYDEVASHFPAITPQDRELLRSDGRTKVWENSVMWARNDLRVAGQLNGGQRGIWQITSDGKKRLREDLVQLGLPLSDVEAFIRGSDTLPQRLGQRWSPQPLSFRPRGSRRQKPGPKSIPQAIEPAPEVQKVSKLVVSPLAPLLQQTTVVGPSLTAVQPGSGDIVAQVLARVQALTPKNFEHLVAVFLKACGLADVVVTAYSQDGGIDGHCVVPFVGVKVGFQAKRFASTHPIGAPIMQQFKGSLTYHGHERGIFVSTSSFTDGAVEVANGPGVPVVLVNGHGLVDQMLEKGLGIKTIPVTKQEIDAEFFSNLADQQ